MLIVELERPDGDPDECREAIDLGRDERRVVVANEHEHEERRRAARHGEHRAVLELRAEALRGPRRPPIGGEAFTAEERLC
jgi:hypothetical protein